MRRLGTWLSRRSHLQLAGLVAALLVLLGAVDFLTGAEISFSIFYLIPVAISTWRLGRSWGNTVSIGSGLVWLVADLAARSSVSDPAIAVWNSAVRIGFFLLFVAVLSNLREARGEANRLLAEVQRRLVPTDLPQIPGVEVAATWSPAEAVGGDYFDVIRFGENRLGLCIADVSGKGIEAALVMSNLQAAVRTMAPGGLSPRKLCGRLNDLLCASTGPGRFVSLFYAVLDTNTASFVYTNAGHNPVVLSRRSVDPMRLATGGPVLGVFPEVRFVQEKLRLDAGDRLILFTDGLTEVTNRTGEEYGENRLIQLLSSHRELSAHELQERLLTRVTAFHGTSFSDDVTLVIVAVGESPAIQKSTRRSAA